MLKKLLKYELQSTARIFIPLYGLMLLFAVISKFFMKINANYVNIRYLDIPMGISVTAFIGIIVATFVITFVVMIQRFYKNLLTDEGYLMFTLPVGVHSHIFSKLLVACLWNVLSAFVALFAIAILVAEPEFVQEFSQAWSALWYEVTKFGSASYVVIAELVVLMALSLFSSIINIYAAIAAGHLVTKHRVMGSLGAFFVFSVIEQTVASILMISAVRFWDLNFSDSFVLTPANVMTVVQIGLLLMILFILAFSIGYYFITTYVLRKKLNLE